MMKHVLMIAMACLLMQQTAIAQPVPPEPPPCGGPFGPPCQTPSVTDALLFYFPFRYDTLFSSNNSFFTAHYNNIDAFNGPFANNSQDVGVLGTDVFANCEHCGSAAFNGYSSRISVSEYSYFSDSYSVSYWIAPDQIPPAQTQVVMMQQSGYGASQIGWNSLIEPNGKLNFIVGNGEGQPQSVCNYGTLTPGFNHVVQVFTPTQAIVYVNGIKKGYYNHNGAVVGYSGSPLVIGLGNGAMPNTTGFTGLLDEIAIYNRALDATEVLALFNNIPVEEAMNLPLQEDLENETAYPSATTGIPYQAEVRTETGELYANGYVQVRFSLHEFTPDGTISYQEYHDLTTNELGLLSAYIGNGLVAQGEFNSINWAQARKFLQVEIHFGDGQWITMGNQQLMSVPYALYAANGPVGPAGAQGPVGPVGPQGEAGANGLSAYELWLAQGNSGTQLDFLASGGGAPLFLQNTISFPGLGGDGTTAAQTLFTFNARFGERYSIQAKLSAWTARYTCSAGVNVWIENSSGTVVPIRGFDQFSFGVSDCNNAIGGEKICLGYFAPENTDEFTVRCNYSVGGYNNYQNQGSNSGGVQAMIYKL